MNVMMRPYFKNGLSKLKEYSENLPAGDAMEDVVITETEVEPQISLAIKDSADIYNIGDKMYELYTELESYMKETGIEMTGPPYAVFYNWDSTAPIVFETGFPVKEKVEGKGRIYFTESPGGKVITTYHYGDYESSEYTYLKISEYIDENNKVICGPSWEVYLTDPSTEPDTSKWVTQIFFPVE